MSKFDTQRINIDNPLPAIMQKAGIAVKRDGPGEYWALCPFHGEDTPSFHIYTNKRGVTKGQCFGCDWHGDTIDFVSEWFRMTFEQACESLGAKRELPTTVNRPAPAPIAGNDPYEGYKITRPPSDAAPIIAGEKTPPLLNPKRLDDRGRPKFIRYMPKMVFPYRDREGKLIGYVLRVEFDDKKVTPAILWMHNEDKGFSGWSHGSMPTPRPLYGLDRLEQFPQKRALIVEGEKCADRGEPLLPGNVVMSWLGGGKSYHKSNWRQLRGRAVTLWPDNDEEGIRTMLGYFSKGGEWRPGIAELLMDAGVEDLAYIEPPGNAKPEGWDIADAVAEGWDTKQTIAWAKSRLVRIDRQWIATRRKALAAPQDGQAASPSPGEGLDEEPPPEEPRPQAITQDQAAPDPAGTDDGGWQAERKDNVFRMDGVKVDPDEYAPDWRTMLIHDPKKGTVYPKLPENFYWTIKGSPGLKHVFRFDQMARAVMVTKRPPWKVEKGVWKPAKAERQDLTRLVGHLNRMGLQPTQQQASDNMYAVSIEDSYDPIVEWLHTLRWDGVPRVTGGSFDGEVIKPWLVQYLGADDTEINMTFGLRWLIGGIARQMQPGCKMDQMLILEGPQGLKKSSALRTLATVNGTVYFTDEIHDLSSREAPMSIQGKWIIEMAELASLKRGDAEAAKFFLSRQVDNIRLPYAPTYQDFPRRNIFGGTVNPGSIGYMKDPTGGRRYWPVRCTNIDLEALQRDTDQLWAEALHHYNQGVQSYLTDAETKLAKAVQDQRYHEDPWNEVIDKLIYDRKNITIKEVIDELGIPKERQNQLVMKRIMDHLLVRGFHKGTSKPNSFGPPVITYSREVTDAERNNDVMRLPDEVD